MLSNIMAYLSETANQHFPSQTSPLRCAQVVYLQKDHFQFWLVAAMSVYIHTKCSDFTN